MEFIIEAVFGSIIGSIPELWTAFMKKRNPNYESSRSIKLIAIIIGILLMLIGTALILGFFFLIEWIFPNLLDVVGLD